MAILKTLGEILALIVVMRGDLKKCDLELRKLPRKWRRINNCREIAPPPLSQPEIVSDNLRYEHLSVGSFWLARYPGRRRQRASKSGLSVLRLLDYLGWPRRRLHSPRAERMKVTPPSPPSAQSVQTKKKPPVDLAISP